MDRANSLRDPATILDWLPSLLQATDSYYPTGSYAHSFGLEGLIQQGIVRDRATLRDFVFASSILALERNEMPLARFAYAAFGGRDWESIGELCVLSSALKTSRESRMASENIGRQRADLGAALHASALAKAFLERADQLNWPMSVSISAALEGQIKGVPEEGVLVSIYYASISSLLASAMKLLRLGQNGAQSLLCEALTVAPATILRSQKISRDEIGWFNPWLDIASARHETADARMFIS